MGRRRAGGFDDNVLSLSPSIWYAVRKEEGYAEDAAMSQWLDHSGNGFHATQSDPGYQPKYKSTAMNGSPGAFFDGADYFLATGLPITGDVSVLVVGTVLNIASHGYGRFASFSDGVNADTSFFIPVMRGSTYGGGEDVWHFGNGVIKASVTFDAPFVALSYMGSAGCGLYRDGALIDTTAGKVVGPMPALGIGASASTVGLPSNGVYGLISEILVFNRALLAAEISLLNDGYKELFSIA